MRLVKLKVYGYVQGVFYRSRTKAKACQLGLAGYVKNLPDGTVEVVARGGSKLLQELIDFCRNNPGSSQVEKIEAEWLDDWPEKLDVFEVRH